MKKKNSLIDKSTPYRSLGINKVSAPAKNANEPSGTKIKSGGDMRCKGTGK